MVWFNMILWYKSEFEVIEMHSFSIFQTEMLTMYTMYTIQECCCHCRRHRCVVISLPLFVCISTTWSRFRRMLMVLPVLSTMPIKFACILLPSCQILLSSHTFYSLTHGTLRDQESESYFGLAEFWSKWKCCTQQWNAFHHIQFDRYNVSHICCFIVLVSPLVRN